VNTVTLPVGCTRISPHSNRPGARAERTGDVRRRDAAGLDVAAVAQAALEALRLALLAALLEALDVRQRVGLEQRAVVVAGVVLQRHRRLVRELADEVALADLVLRQPSSQAARVTIRSSR
jgi:hypothetical protein